MVKYNKDLYVQPFGVCSEKYDIEIKVGRNKKLKYPRNTKDKSERKNCHGTFIIGLDMNLEDGEDDKNLEDNK